MICFEHQKANGNASHGLGSDFGNFAKDCGYYFHQGAGSGLAFRAGGVYGDVRRHRCVNNYLIWIMVEWGQWLNGTTEYAWMTTHPDEVDPMNRLTAVQKLHVTVLSRAHNFLAMLETDTELQRLGVDPHCYLAIATASAVGPSTTSAYAHDHFPTADTATAVRACEAFLARECFEPAVALTTALRPLYDVLLTADVKITALGMGFQTGVSVDESVRFPGGDELQVWQAVLLVV
jgi:hypothetical protein